VKESLGIHFLSFFGYTKDYERKKLNSHGLSLLFSYYVYLIFFLSSSYNRGRLKEEKI